MHLHRLVSQLTGSGFDDARRVCSKLGEHALALAAIVVGHRLNLYGGNKWGPEVQNDTGG